MMTKNQINKREQLEMLTIEQLVPPFNRAVGSSLFHVRKKLCNCGLASQS